MLFSEFMEFNCLRRKEKLPLPLYSEKISRQSLKQVAHLLLNIAIAYAVTPIQEGDEVIHHVSAIGESCGIDLYARIIAKPDKDHPEHFLLKHHHEPSYKAPVWIKQSHLSRTYTSIFKDTLHRLFKRWVNKKASYG